MKRWEERTLFQQLLIILSFIFGLVLLYLLIHVLGIAYTIGIFLLVLLPALCVYQIVVEYKQKMHKRKSLQIPCQRKKSEKSKPLKLTTKEKFIVIFGTIFIIISILVSVKFQSIKIFFLLLIFLFLVFILAFSLIRTIKEIYFCLINIFTKRKNLFFQIIKGIAFAIYEVWIIGFMLPFVILPLTETDQLIKLSQIRFPLGTPRGLAIDSKGHIYYMSGIYSRIQVYDKNGRFLRGWFFLAPGPVNTPRQMIIDNKGKLHVEKGYYEENGVIDYDRKMYTVFSPEGKLVKKHSKKFADTKIPNAFERKDKEGNIYQIKHKFFIPNIFKTLPSGKTSLLISDPFYLKFINQPFPNAICLIIILSIYHFWNYLKKKRNRDLKAASKN